jgi:hypothetical protein
MMKDIMEGILTIRINNNMKVTIKQFIDFRKKEIPEDKLEVEMLKHFLGIDMSDRLSLVLNTYQVKQLVDLFSADDHQLIHTFKHRGIEYAFIPNLSEDLTLGEYIDLNSYITEVDDTIKWLSVLYRPITSKHSDLYTIEDYSGKEYPFEDLDVKVLLGAQHYFFYLAKAYLNSIQPSSKVEEVMEMN